MSASVPSLSRRQFLSASVALGSGLLVACQTTDVLTVPAGMGRDETAGSLPIVNALRAKNGLPPLSYDPVAVKAALQQAARMARAQKMQHEIGFGDSFYKRMKAAGVQMPAAENIASGQQSVEDANSAWIHSKKHLENMLGRYSGLGVAVVFDPAHGNRPYWAMVLSG